MENKPLTRRQWLQTALYTSLAGMSGFAGLSLLSCTKSNTEENNQADLNDLVIYSGPATPAVPLVHLAESDLLKNTVNSVRFHLFHGVDEVRAGLVGNGWLISMVPSNMAAILYNKGMPIRYMSVLT